MRVAVTVSNELMMNITVTLWRPKVRRFSFEDDRLVLNADTAWGAVRIVWEKL
jgi:hypothetical protein